MSNMSSLLHPTSSSTVRVPVSGINKRRLSVANVWRVETLQELSHFEFVNSSEENDHDISNLHDPIEQQESRFCTDFSCCGVSLPNLHALLQHYEEVHAVHASPSKQIPAKSKSSTPTTPPSDTPSSSTEDDDTIFPLFDLSTSHSESDDIIMPILYPTLLPSSSHSSLTLSQALIEERVRKDLEKAKNISYPPPKETVSPYETMVPPPPTPPSSPAITALSQPVSATKVAKAIKKKLQPESASSSKNPTKKSTFPKSNTSSSSSVAKKAIATTATKIIIPLTPPISSAPSPVMSNRGAPQPNKKRKTKHIIEEIKDYEEEELIDYEEPDNIYTDEDFDVYQADDTPYMIEPKRPQKKNKKKFRCPHSGCGRAYRNPAGLKYHIQHGHDGVEVPEATPDADRPYVCSYCEKSYKNSGGLKYHIDHHHTEEE